MKILFVEDNPQDIARIQRSLQKVYPSIEFVLCGTYQEALQKIRQSLNYDLILADINLPEGDGLNLIAKIREKISTVAIIALSRLGNESTAVAALKSGADDYITKKKDFASKLPPAIEYAIQIHNTDNQKIIRPLRIFYGDHNKRDADLIQRHFQKHAPFINLEHRQTTEEIQAAISDPRIYEKFDVLLLNYHIPGLDVFEFIKDAIQIRRLDIPIVLLSKEGEEDTAVQALKFGVADYIVMTAGYLYRLPVTLENVFYRAQINREKAALDESEAKFRLLVEHVPAAIYLAENNNAHATVYISPQISEISGYLAKEWMLDSSLWEKLVHPTDLPRVSKEFNRDTKDASEIRIEYRLIRRDGKTVWLRDEASPVIGSNGEVEYLRGILIDITEQKRSEMVQDALYEITKSVISTITLDELFKLIHKLLNTIVPADNFFIALYDHEKGLITFPYFVDEINQQPDPQPPGKNLTSYVLKTNTALLAHPETIEDLINKHKLNAQDQDLCDWLGVPLIIDNHIIGVMAVQSYSENIKFSIDDMYILSFVSSQVAISIERKKSEKALINSEERYRTLAEASHDLIFIASPDGQLEYINRFAAGQFNSNPEDLVGKHISDLFSIQLFDRNSRELQDVIQSGQSLYLESQAVIRNNKLGLGFWLVPIFDSARNTHSVMAVARDITERMETENALRSSEERFSKIFHASSIPTSLTTMSDGLYLDVNNAFLELLGLERSQVIGHFVSEFNFWDSGNERIQFIDRLQKEESVLGMEKDVLTPDGKKRSIQAFFELVHLQGKQCTIAMFNDITEQKRIEMALRDSQEFLTLVLDTIPSYLFWKDHNSIYIGCNANFAKAAGLSDPSQIAGKSDYDLAWTKEEAEAYLKDDLEVMETDAPKYHIIESQLQANGKQAWLDTTKIPLHDEQGNVIGLLGTYEDITERKKVEASLWESELSYRGLYNSVSDAIIIQTSEGIIIDVNEGAIKMYGYSRNQLVGKPPDFLSAPGRNRPEEYQDAITQAIKNKAQRFEFWVTRKNGDILPTEIRLNKGAYYGQEVVFALAQDISERKKAEEQLKRQLDERSILYTVAVVGAEAETEDQLFEHTTQIIGAMLFPDDFGIFFVDRENKQLLPHPSYQSSLTGDLPKAIPIGKGIIGRVAASGEALRIGNVRNHPDYVENRPDICSEICVPIKISNEVIGVINAQSSRKNFFSVSDQQLLATIAKQLSIAIEKMRLFGAERKRRQESETLREAAAIITSTLDRDRAIELILEQLQHVVPHDSASVQILRDGYLEIVGGHGWDNPKDVIGLRFPVPGDNPNTIVILEKRVHILNEAIEQHRPFLEKPHNHIRSWLGAPLIIHNKVIGMLAVDSKEENYFTQENSRLISAFANQVAITLENARLFTETRRKLVELEAINRLSTIMRTAQTSEIMIPALLNETISLLDMGAGEIWLHNKDTDELIQVAASGYMESIPVKRIKSTEGIAGHTFTSREVYVYSDPCNDPLLFESSREHTPGNWDGICIPIQSTTELIGVLSIASVSPRKFSKDELELLSTLTELAGNAIYRAELYERTERQVERLTALREIDASIATGSELNATLEILLNHLKNLLEIDATDILLYDTNTNTLDCVKQIGIEAQSINLFEQRKKYLTEKHTNTGELLHISSLSNENDEKRKAFLYQDGFFAYVGLPLISKGQWKGVIEVFQRGPLSIHPNWVDFFQTLAGQATIAIDNNQLFTETQRRLKELEVVNKISIALRSAIELADMLPIILDETLQLFNLEAGAIWLYEPESGDIAQAAARGWLVDLPVQRQKATLARIGYDHLASKNITVSEALNKPYIFLPRKEDIPENWEAYYIPIQTTHNTIGTLFVSTQKPRQLTNDELGLLTTITEIAGNGIFRAELFEQAEKQVNRLTALRDIDTAIASSFDIKVTLNILLDHVRAQLNIDAAHIMIYNPKLKTLSTAASSGFISPTNFHFQQRLGEGLAGKAILERTTFSIIDLRNEPDYIRKQEFLNDRFISYYGIPLIGKGEIKGILEVFQRSQHNATPEWLEFLHTIAGQAAIAIDNSQLFDNLQQRNQELSLAYDTTLEGWGRALELRDKETQGHTRRVTDLTLLLAKKLGISDEEMTHIHRGVLLHDIGKMGVPDRILRKTGELTSSEWESMKQHPQYAYDLLYPIRYLRPALDIPYFHHERWDGNGYPQGLKGEEIPLAARIFTVVDVWDALLSDRPYRKAWSKEKTIEYIKNKSGTRFDPKIVNIFLEMAKEIKI